jgi:hypothetical protein
MADSELDDDESSLMPESSSLLFENSHQYHSISTTTTMDDVLIKDDSSKSKLWSDGPTTRGAKIRACASRFCLTFGCLLILGGVIYLRQNIDNLFRTSGKSKRSVKPSYQKYTISFRNSYPAIDSNYPWDNVVEPEIETTLSVGLTRQNAEACVWTIEHEGASDATQHSGCGDFKYSFTDCPRLFSIRVTVGTDEVATTAMCKYGETHDNMRFEQQFALCSLSLASLLLFIGSFPNSHPQFLSEA